VPRIERREFLRMLEWAALERRIAPAEAARTPFAVVSAFDYLGRRQALLPAPVEVMREGATFLSVQVQPAEGTPFADDRLAAARSAGLAAAPRAAGGERRAEALLPAAWTAGRRRCARPPRRSSRGAPVPAPCLPRCRH
jgi:hypothetical protein